MRRAHKWFHAVVVAASMGSVQAAAHAQQAPAPSGGAEPQAAPAPAPAPAPAAIPPSLELWGALGGSVLFGQQANPAYNGSITRVGAVGELGIAYRSSYFVDPFFMVTYASLARGAVHLPAGEWGPAGDLNQHLVGWFLSPGITADIWRIRLRLGLGFAVLRQTFTFQGNHSSSGQFPIAHQLGVGFNALDNGGFRLDAEARAVVAPGADIAFVTLNLVARGDIIVFGSSSTQVSAR